MLGDQDNSDISGLPAGAYQLNITVYGDDTEFPTYTCYFDTTVTLTQPTAVVATATDIVLPCFGNTTSRSEEHTSELQSRLHLVCRLLLEKKKIKVKIFRL